MQQETRCDSIFDALDSDIPKMTFNIPGIKRVEFSADFRADSMIGSEYNDPLILKGGRVLTANNASGILGGISNSMPIVFRVAFKPTSSWRP